MIKKRKKYHRKRKSYHTNEDHTYEYLQELLPNIKIKKQKTIVGPIVLDGEIIQTRVCIDFYFVKDNKEYYVEYNGRQHYESVKRFGGKKAFTKRQKRDEWVRRYCRDNNYILIEIDGREFINEGIKEYLKGVV